MKIVCAARNYRENGVHASIPIEFFLKSTEAILEPGGTVEFATRSSSAHNGAASVNAITESLCM